MALKLFRCTRPTCTKKEMGRFQSETWECPQCGLSMKDPKLGHKIIRLTVIHFDPPSEWPGTGLNVRACDHAQPIQASQGQNGIPNPWNAGTANPKHVTCEACKLTKEYKDSLLAQDDDENPKVAAATIASMNRLEAARTI